ncbi:uncharacterized protein LOC123905399 [Trifolium pratense]|uniref:uncharacterized protein LOC123905399 n=1 Tax=Trifolium pratense TaxID=57577 RepID=UPI001E697575|nr:uncharacterized protein LOC123905399 [Trifolium pratense]
MAGNGSGASQWELGWRRRLFVWEQDLLRDLLEVLPAIEFSDSADAWFWDLEDDGRFLVKSVYLLLGSVFNSESVFNDSQLKVFKNIVKSPTPSKVLAFSWKILRSRIPTKVNLVHHGIHVNGGMECVFCRGREETSDHLFLYCDFADLVWKAICRWLGLVIVIPPNPFLLFDCFLGAASSKNIRSGFSLIWHATVWSIWRLRNEVIFSNGVKDLEKVVNALKLLSWKWGLRQHKIPVCLFYEWCWDPGLCLRR